MPPEPFDWTLIGNNVRRGRLLRGYSQEALARLAGLSISTIRHVEGGRPIRMRSLLRVAESFDETIESIRMPNGAVLTHEVDYVSFREVSATWVSGSVDRRSNVPVDNHRRIQDPAERARLGRLGLLAMFLSNTGFLMPEGPGLIFIELYDRSEGDLNGLLYRDCTIACVAGKARLRIGESILEMIPGDVMGYRSKDLVWMEPAEESELPVRLTWTGAVRLGSPVREVGKGERVKRRKAGGEG